MNFKLRTICSKLLVPLTVLFLAVGCGHPPGTLPLAPNQMTSGLDSDVGVLLGGGDGTGIEGGNRDTLRVECKGGIYLAIYETPQGTFYARVSNDRAQRKLSVTREVSHPNEYRGNAFRFSVGALIKESSYQCHLAAQLGLDNIETDLSCEVP